MQLYDIIPDNLFSPLASKNKRLYANGLFVILDAFRQQLKISKDELISMMSASLESELMYADFSDEELFENELTLSGKAHFLVRKFRQTGWILLETGADMKEYISVPSYSYQIIQLLHDLKEPTKEENFAFVYSTYSSLKNADETRDPFEMATALYDGAARTEKLVESLKSVFHSITYYNQRLIEELNINNVLYSHYEMYQEEIIQRILSPLKIRDSVPKYKQPLTNILKKWLVDKNALESMAEYIVSSSGGEGGMEKCRMEIQRKIYYIIDTYENLERNYIQVIDDKNTRYTRATTQKMDYLINSDQTIKGDLINILKALSDDETAGRALELTSDSFEIYELSWLSEESLYDRKRGVRRKREAQLYMEDNMAQLAEKARAMAAQTMKNKYGRRETAAFVEGLLSGRDSISTEEFDIKDDDIYIKTLLAAVHANDENSFYNIEIHEGQTGSKQYRVPLIVYKRRKGR